VKFDELAAALVTSVRGMSPGHVRTLASLLAAARSAADAHRVVLGAVPNPIYRQHAAQILEIWEQNPECDGSMLALALQTGLTLLEQEQGAEIVEPVATGPTSAYVALRHTRAVLLSLIEDAKRELLMTSYVTYPVPDLVRALQLAQERGVAVRLLLETIAGSGGALKVDGSFTFRSLRGVEMYAWPVEQRSQGARLHAKVAVADGEVAFVTSANLTGNALDENLEVGVLIRGGPCPRRLQDHFRALISAGIVRQL
jgi:cardiolipin synthase